MSNYFSVYTTNDYNSNEYFFASEAEAKEFINDLIEHDDSAVCHLDKVNTPGRAITTRKQALSDFLGV